MEDYGTEVAHDPSLGEQVADLRSIIYSMDKRMDLLKREIEYLKLELSKVRLAAKAGPPGVSRGW